MKEKSVVVLQCPKISKSKRCLGNLEPKILTQKKDEIVDGFLICQSCKNKYPIIQGIPVLLDNLKEYFKDNFVTINDSIGGLEKIHRDLLLYIHALTKANFNSRTLSPRFFNSGDYENYISSHYGYGSPKEIHSFLFKCLFKFFLNNNMFKILQRWSSKADRKNSMAIDIGCNVGGYTYFLAQKCVFSYGVDLSYPALFNANMIIKNIPCKRDWFLQRQKGRQKRIPMKIKKLENLDFIVASADNLPFRDGAFQLSLLGGLIDIAQKKSMILREAERTLKKKGRVLITFVPFFDKVNLGYKKSKLTERNIKKLLKKIYIYDTFYTPNISMNASRFILEEKDNCYMLGIKK